MFRVITSINVAIFQCKHYTASFRPRVCNFSTAKPNVWWKLVLVLAGMARLLSATSIVVVTTDKGFAIAADSRLVDGAGNKLSDPACKVFITNNRIAWGFAGLMGSDGFDPRSELRRLLDTPDLISLNTRIQGVMAPLLSNQAKWLQKNEPDKFRFLLAGNDIFQVFVATRNGVIVQEYRVTQTDGVVSVAMAGLSGCIAEVRKCIAGEVVNLGESGEITTFRTEHPIAMRQFGSPIDIAKFLVGLEIDSHPESVGLPIDVLELKGGVATWIDRKAQCEDAASPTPKPKNNRH